MSATTDYYVSPSTSLLLIKNLSKPINVYLRGYASSFTVSIRDTTGSPSITTDPVRISTIEGARFLDGSFYYPLNTPYGFVNLTLRNSNVWCLNHTSGQVPAAAAATIGTLSVATTYIGFQSTAQKIVSTFQVETLTTPNSISITGPFIVSNLSTPGFVLFEQALNVYGQTTLYNQLNISSSAFGVSSMFVEDLQPVPNPVRIYSSLGIGGNATLGEVLHVGSTLHLQSTIQVETLQTTLSTLLPTVVLDGSLQVASIVSTLGNLVVAGEASVGNGVVFGNEVVVGGQLSTTTLSVNGPTTIYDSFLSQSNAAVASSLRAWSTVQIKGSLELQSTLGVAGALYPSSLSTVGFSTLGSFSTFTLEILSTAQITGNVSTVFVQSYQFFSVGGRLQTPAVVSSLGALVVGGFVSVRENGVVSELQTSSSVGVGGSASIASSTFAKHLTVQGATTIGGDFEVLGGISTQASLAVRTDATLYGNLIVLGGSEISSFLVNSYLLSNLQIQASSPFISFQASSLHASTFETELSHVLSVDPLSISSAFASTVQASNVFVENARLESGFAESFFSGSNLTLSADSAPKFGLASKTQFLQGFSTFGVLADQIQADRVEGSFVGTVSYLSNVPVPFSNLSGITLALSTLSLSELNTSSFTASTLVVSKFLLTQSSILAPYFVMEAQGYPFRSDVSQILNISPSLLAVNRKLFFNSQTQQIGLGTSTPIYDFDVSGLVYTSNLVYSSINTLTGTTGGVLNLSTILVSSSYVLNSLQVGTQGLQIASQVVSGDPSVQINQIDGYSSNLFGIFDFVVRSSIFLNSGVEVKHQRVFLNPYFDLINQFIDPSAALDLRGVARADEVYVSSPYIFETVQAKTVQSRFLVVASNPDPLLNRISTSFEKLYLNDFVVMTTNSYTANRYVGIGTDSPQATLDVNGNVYFSTALTRGSLQADLVAMSAQEI